MTKNLKDKFSNTQWFYLSSGISSGKVNMDIDNDIFNSYSNNKIIKPILRTYGWEEETISIGINQNILDVSRLNSNKLPIVKRITGGQAVFHGDENRELTYSIVGNFGIEIKKIYVIIGEVLILFLNKYGLSSDFGHSSKSYFNSFNCFESKTACDIVVDEQKIIGSAQARKGNIVLQHGSIKLDLISSLSGNLISYTQAESDLISAFRKSLNIDFIEFPIDILTEQ